MIFQFSVVCTDTPGPPGLPEIVDYDEHMVDLKWEPPIRDGGAPVTGTLTHYFLPNVISLNRRCLIFPSSPPGYIIELKSKYDTNFVKAVEVPGPMCRAKVPKLEEGQQYQFRVKAVNKAGPGEASEPTLVHIAKPKLCEYFIDFGK